MYMFIRIYIHKSVFDKVRILPDQIPFADTQRDRCVSWYQQVNRQAWTDSCTCWVALYVNAQKNVSGSVLMYVTMLVYTGNINAFSHVCMFEHAHDAFQYVCACSCWEEYTTWLLPRRTGAWLSKIEAYTTIANIQMHSNRSRRPRCNSNSYS